MKRILAVVLFMSLFLTACSSEKAIESDRGKAKENLTIDQKTSGNDDDANYPIITLKILLPASAEPQMSVLQQYDTVMTESANQYLRENNKDYRVRYQTIQMEGELPTQEELEGTDIICTRVSPENAEYYYIDIASELREGKLKTIFDSVPELYWERVNVRGAIYSLLATPPASQMLYVDNLAELESLNLEIPDELIGKSVENWESFVSKVYDETGEVAYIRGVAGSDQECPASAGNVWNAKFQLVLPFLGIDFENPDQGVQCIYESEYGRKIQDLWGRWFEAGYISDGRENVKWSVGSAYDITVKEIEDGSCGYPLQNTTYASPQVAGVSYYTTGISKVSTQLELVYQFLNELAEDEELHEAMIRAEGERVWFDILPETLLVEENNHPDVYSGTKEENIQLQQERFAVAQLPPIPGFVLDTTSVQEEVDAIMETLSSQNLYTQLKAMESSGVVPEYAAVIHYIPQEILDILYEQGLQVVINEANRQLEEYLNQ